MNEYDRHLEHSEVYEHTLHKKKDSSGWSLEEYFENVQVTENLHIAINKLPEVQKSRLKKYYFEEKTFDEKSAKEKDYKKDNAEDVFAAFDKMLSSIINKAEEDAKSIIKK